MHDGTGCEKEGVQSVPRTVFFSVPFQPFRFFSGEPIAPSSRPVSAAARPHSVHHLRALTISLTFQFHSSSMP